LLFSDDWLCGAPKLAFPAGRSKPRSGREWAVSDEGVVKIIWWLGLVAAPLVLIGIELLHPAHFTAEPGTVAFLSQPQPYDPRHVALA
jgi:hypothetical protein